MRKILRRSAIALAAGAAIAVATYGAAASAERRQVFGNWLLTMDHDRFSDADNVMAVTLQDASLFAVRCMRHTFTFALRDANITGAVKAGDLFKIKFRADRYEAIDTVGIAIDDEIIQIDVTSEMRRQLLGPKEFAFRVRTPVGTEFDSVFRVGQQTDALVSVLRACPAN